MSCSPVLPARSTARMAGMTLIELIVTVAVLFTLAAFAVPAYRDYLHTGRQARIMETVQTFTLFEQNYFIETGAYADGVYNAGSGTSTFPDAMGFRMGAGQDQVSFRVEAGACGNLDVCYRVIATDTSGTTGTYEAATSTWTWGP